MTKSIDGINRTPVTHDIYVAKRRLDSNRRFVSIERAQPRQPSIDLDTIDLSLPQPKQELVINISKRYSVRASLYIVFQYLITAAIAIAAAYSTSIGQWFVLAFACYAFATKQDSRLTYGMTLFVLITIPLFQLINHPGVANNMAVYVFELLVLAAVQSFLESRPTKKSNETPPKNA